MTIDKFDPNLVLVNINKLKPYRFVEDHTRQIILAKPSDFLPMPKKINWKTILITCSLSHFDKLFTKEPVKLHTGGLIVDNLIEKKTNSNLSNQ
jgi:hypothetical protein